jgi:hypothetical protein
MRLLVLMLLHNVFSCYYMCPHTGGVGHIMIQIARAFDIQVITPLLPLYTSTAQALVRFHEGSMKSISRLC